MYAEIFSPEVLGILVVIIILLFGSSKLPQLARGLGQAKKEFQAGLKEGEDAKGTTPQQPNQQGPST